MATRTTAEWLELFEKTSVPINKVNTLEDVIADEHLNATGFWQVVDHPTEGKVRHTGFAVNFFDTPADVTRLPAPRLGENTRELLREAGYAPDRIEALIASGAAKAAD